MKKWHHIFLTISVICALGLTMASFILLSVNNKGDVPEPGNGQENGEDIDTALPSGGDTSAVFTEKPDHPVIFASVVSHNEDTFSPLYPDFIKDEAAFWEQRGLVVSFADMLYEAGVTYNFQTDWNFLLAIQAYDQGTPSTNGKNILRYLSEDLNFSIDPHSHQNGGYNLADVAYLIDALGVEPTGIVGGFTAIPSEEATWQSYWSPMDGQKYQYRWTPTILWGGARPGHRNESEVWVSGVWRPESHASYTVHDPNAALPNVGGFQTGWDGLSLLVEALEAGKLSSDQIYTITMMNGQHMMSEESIADFEANILKYKDLTEQGYIEWTLLQDVVSIWEEYYDANGDITLYSDLATDTATNNRESFKPSERTPDASFPAR